MAISFILQLNPCEGKPFIVDLKTSIAFDRRQIIMHCLSDFKPKYNDKSKKNSDICTNVTKVCIFCLKNRTITDCRHGEDNAIFRYTEET